LKNNRHSKVHENYVRILATISRLVRVTVVTTTRMVQPTNVA